MLRQLLRLSIGGYRDVRVFVRVVFSYLRKLCCVLVAGRGRLDMRFCVTVVRVVLAIPQCVTISLRWSSDSRPGHVYNDFMKTTQDKNRLNRYYVPRSCAAPTLF